MKPALITLAISVALMFVAGIIYSKATEQHAAKMGIHTAAK